MRLLCSRNFPTNKENNMQGREKGTGTNKKRLVGWREGKGRIDLEDSVYKDAAV